MRIELNVVLSVTGNTLCNDSSGRNAMGWPSAFAVAEGTGAPVRKKRPPITPGKIGLIAGHKLPSFGDVSGFLPVSAVVLALEAKNAWVRAPQMFAATPLPINVLTKAACGAVRPVNVRATGLTPGMTGMVTDEVRPWLTLLVKNPDS